MPTVDFLTNVETALLALIGNNAMLSEYNPQRWDSDVQVELPRVVLGLRSRRDPDETPYQRIEVAVRFEGRPKKEPLTAVMSELVTLLERTEPSDLQELSQDTVAFIGKAINVAEDRPIVAGLRTWTLGFVIYAVPIM